MTATEDDVTRALTGQDPAAYRTLDEHLAGEEPDFDAGPVELADELHADRWLRRLRAIGAELRRVDDLAYAQRQQINQWELAQRERLLNKSKFYEDSLVAYHRARLAADPDDKTISLPNGTLKSTAQPDEYIYDEDEFVGWATGHMPELVRVPEPVEKPDKNAVRKAVKAERLVVEAEHVVSVETGEVVPGLTVVERGVKFDIDLGDEQ